MKLKNIALVIGLVCPCLLIICYIAVMAHVCRGSKDLWVISQLLMLILSNIGGLLTIAPDRNLFLDDKRSSIGQVWELAIGIALRDSFFGLAHYLLADKYRTIQETYTGKRKEKVKSQCRKVTHYILIFCNIFFPIFASVFVYLFALELYRDTQVNDWPILTAISSSLVGFTQFVSGAILITSVYKIKAFFKAKEDEESLDTKALYRHAVAFGLFLITDVAYYVMWPIYTVNYTNKKFFNWYLSVIIFWLIGSFVS